MNTSFTISLDGVDYVVEMDGNTFSVNGYPFVVGSGNDDSVTVDGIAYDIKLNRDQVSVDGVTYNIQIKGLETAPNSEEPVRQTKPLKQAGVISAIMPGSIIRVLVTEGDKVKSGDVVIVLEAMKMENELKAPLDGIVKALHVKPGQIVEMNAPLAEIEPLD